MRKQICLACALNGVPVEFAEAVEVLREILQSDDCGYEIKPGSDFALGPDLLLVILDHTEVYKELSGILFLARQKKTLRILAVASATTSVPEKLVKLLTKDLSEQCDGIRRYANLPRDVSQMVCASIAARQPAAA